MAKTRIRQAKHSNRRFETIFRPEFATICPKIARRPESLNRIGDNIVPFNFIADDGFMIEIVRAKLSPLKDALKKRDNIEDIYFENEEKALAALVSRVDRSNGGRGIVNEIVPRLIDPLAAFLFETEENPIMVRVAM